VLRRQPGEPVPPHCTPVPTSTRASDYLDWSEAEHFTVNQSNAREEYGDRHYAAIPPELEPEEIEYLDDNAVQCPYEYTDGEIECGTCRLCIDAKGPDVYINQH